MDVPVASDSNYLFGALMQSGAALVAIVGGLLGARYVSLHSEKNTTSHELDKAKAVLASAERHEQITADKYWSLRARARLLDPHVFRASVHANEIEKVLHNETSIFEPHSSAAVSAVKELLEDIRRAKEDLTWDPLPEEFADFAREKKYWHEARRLASTDFATDDVFNLVGLTVYLDHVTADQAAAESAGGAGDTVFVSKIRHEWHDAARNVSYLAKQEAEVAQRVNNDAKVSVTLARRDVAEHEARVESLFAGESFRLSSQVLASVAVVTVAVPGILMVPSVYTWPIAVRIASVLLFLLGLYILGRFFWAYGSYLGGKILMPRNVAALLWKVKPVEPKA